MSNIRIMASWEEAGPTIIWALINSPEGPSLGMCRPQFPKAVPALRQGSEGYASHAKILASATLISCPIICAPHGLRSQILIAGASQCPCSGRSPWRLCSIPPPISSGLRCASLLSWPPLFLSPKDGGREGWKGRRGARQVGVLLVVKPVTDCPCKIFQWKAQDCLDSLPPRKNRLTVLPFTPCFSQDGPKCARPLRKHSA